MRFGNTKDAILRAIQKNDFAKVDMLMKTIDDNDLTELYDIMSIVQDIMKVPAKTIIKLYKMGFPYSIEDAVRSGNLELVKYFHKITDPDDLPILGDDISTSSEVFCYMIENNFPISDFIIEEAETPENLKNILYGQALETAMFEGNYKMIKYISSKLKLNKQDYNEALIGGFTSVLTDNRDSESKIFYKNIYFDKETIERLIKFLARDAYMSNNTLAWNYVEKLVKKGGIIKNKILFKAYHNYIQQRRYDRMHGYRVESKYFPHLGGGFLKQYFE